MVGVAGMLNRQLMLLLLLSIGFVLSKKGFMEEKSRHFLSDLIAKIFLPSSILAVLMSESAGPQYMKGFLVAVGAGFVIEGFSYIFSIVAVKKNKLEERAVLRYAIFSPNASFIGIPIIDGYFGQEGLLYLAALLIPVNIFMFLIGLRLFLPKDGPRSGILGQILHPCVVSVLIGLVCMITGFRPPHFVMETITSLGQCTTALSMILIGGILATVKFKTIFTGSVFYFSALRLVVLPLLALGFMLLIRAPAIVTGVTVVMTGMPAAVATAVLATSNGGNAPYASKLISLSTVLSMLTLPLLAMFVDFILPR
ncbi:AEC family transporter [Ruminococcaceae bacterium OttesenSCG-928-I18]|nr:AEC family transporter [Ruminococcaceae bacterium OttesenSCG-928-I18]